MCSFAHRHLVTIQILVSWQLFVLPHNWKHSALWISIVNRNFTESFTQYVNETQKWWAQFGGKSLFVFNLFFFLNLNERLPIYAVYKVKYTVWHYLRQLKYLTYVSCYSNYSLVALFICSFSLSLSLFKLILCFGPLLAFSALIPPSKNCKTFSTHFLWNCC